MRETWCTREKPRWEMYVEIIGVMVKRRSIFIRGYIATDTQSKLGYCFALSYAVISIPYGNFAPERTTRGNVMGSRTAIEGEPPLLFSK